MTPLLKQSRVSLAECRKLLTPCICVMQPVEVWRKLPNLTHIIKGTSLTTVPDHDTDKAQSASGPTDDALHGGMASAESNASRAVAAGFLATPLGLCCCIAVTHSDYLESGWLRLQTLVQPVHVVSAAASASWQHATVPLLDAKGGSHASRAAAFVLITIACILAFQSLLYPRNWCIPC